MQPVGAPTPGNNGVAEEIERNPSGGTDRHYSTPGGVFHNPASGYAREMAKYEMGWSPYGPPGRPREVVGHRAYPCQMYLIRRAALGGGIEVVHSTSAKSEVERQNFESRGYICGLKEAVDELGRREQEIAVAAAERAHADRRLSPAAQAEVETAEDATADHLAEVPETPINPKRGKDTAPSKRELVDRERK